MNWLYRIPWIGPDLRAYHARQYRWHHWSELNFLDHLEAARLHPAPCGKMLCNDVLR